MPEVSTDHSSSWFLRIVDILVLVVCLSLVFGIWVYGTTHDVSSEREVESRATTLESTIDYQLGHLYSYLYAVKGFYESNAEVTQTDLGTFAATLFHQDGGAVLRLAIIRRVESGEQSEFVDKYTKRHNQTLYKLPTESSYPAQYFVTDILDNQGRVATLNGQNFEAQIDKTAILSGIEAGEHQVFSVVKGVAGIDGYGGDALILGLPIIVDGKVTGVVVLAEAINELSRQINNSVGSAIEWRWVWGGVEIAHQTLPNTRKLVTSTKILKKYTSADIMITASQPLVLAPIWNWILSLGTLMGFVLYGMVYAMSVSGVRASELASTMTVDLHKYKQALDSSNNHIIITDIDGKIVYANSAAQKLTGYTFAEMVGQTPRLWGKQMSVEFYQTFWDTIKNKRKVFEGEIINQRKDGKKYEAYATVSPITDPETKELVGFVGVEYDITERKAAEKDLRRMNELMIGRELRMAELKKQLAEKS